MIKKCAFASTTWETLDNKFIYCLGGYIYYIILLPKPWFTLYFYLRYDGKDRINCVEKYDCKADSW
jgi:hypothetical protein